jgi:hypothetical protein
MTSPDDLARLVAVPALVTRLGHWEGSQDDLEWLRGWMSNAQRVLRAEVQSGGAAEEDAEAVRQDYQAALARLPGLQVFSNEGSASVSEIDPAVSDAQVRAAEDGELLSDVRPDLHAACVEFVRRHLIDDFGLTRPVAETQIADLLIVVSLDRDALGGRMLTFANPATSNGIRVVDGTTGTDTNLRRAAQQAARDLVGRS